MAPSRRLPLTPRASAPVSGTRCVAFLRAINVGGHTVRMEELRRLFGQLALEDVETFIASGNVVFSTRARNLSGLERRIEAHLRAALGYDVATFVRTGAAVGAIARYRPFPEPRMRAAHVVSVGFLARPLGATAVKALMTLRTTTDDFHVHGTEVYWLCRTGQGESDFSNAVFEKATGARVTFRGTPTIVKLAAKHGWDAGGT